MREADVRRLTCPICRGSFESHDAAGALAPHFPFCSERCKMVDLGHWFSESYKVSRPVEDEDLRDDVASADPDAE